MSTTHTVRQLLALSAAFGAAAFGLLCMCGEPLQPVAQDGLRLQVPTLGATYQNGFVRLAWQPPSGQYEYFRIYRTAKTDSLGRPDTSSLVSILGEDSIGHDSLGYSDKPEPSNGVYFYAICAVRIDEDGARVQGLLSPVDAAGKLRMAACTVGVNVSFNINHGDVFTLVPACSLFVNDPGHVLSSVQFTQYSTADTGGQLIQDPNDDSAQALDLELMGFVKTASAGGGAGVPDFGHADGLNVTSPTYNASLAVNGYAWTLRQGAGTKNVWARLTYASGLSDTIRNFIETQPHKVDIVLRVGAGNQLGALRLDTTEKETNDTVSISLFYTSVFPYSIKVYGDSSINTDFDTWLVTNQHDYQFTDGSAHNGGVVSSADLLMTNPRHEQLTGLGVLHDPDHVYTYGLDPADADGSENLSWLLLRSSTGTVSNVQPPSVVGRKDFDSLTSTSTSSPLAKFGRKQFVFVTRFTERYFGGKFIAMYGIEQGQQLVRTYRDVYPAAMKLNQQTAINPNNLYENDTVKQPFSYELNNDTMPALVDLGFAKITQADLVIAHLPDGFAWNKSTTPQTIAVDSLYTMSHNVYQFFPVAPNDTVKAVRWDGIDPRQWSNGYYMVGVVVYDDKGTKAFGRVDGTSVPSGLTNPFRIYVSTSY